MATFDDFCVVTLPLRTLDGRSIDVFVEQKLGDTLLVHDGGKSSAELYAQGIHDSRRRLSALESIAERYDASFTNDIFSVPCKAAGLERAILDIAQCASLAMHDVATHKPLVEELSARERVGHALDVWRPDRVLIEQDYRAKGSTQRVKHRFDYAVIPALERVHGIAVNVLLPTYNPTIQSRNYGFMVLDLKNTPYEEWPKLAVIAKIDGWHRKPLDLVQSLANRTVFLTTDDQDEVDEKVPRALEELMVA